jgi:hypothetical protein
MTVLLNADVSGLCAHRPAEDSHRACRRRGLDLGCRWCRYRRHQSASSHRRSQARSDPQALSRHALGDDRGEDPR